MRQIPAVFAGICRKFGSRGTAGAAAPPAAPSVTAVELAPLPGSEPGTYAAPTDINNEGVIAGASQLGVQSPLQQPTSQRATVWHDGEATALPHHGDSTRTWARVVNDRGQVGVWEQTANGSGVGYLWEDGQVTTLPEDAQAIQAINNRGDLLLGGDIRWLVEGGYAEGGAPTGVWRGGEFHRFAAPSGTVVVSVTSR